MESNNNRVSKYFHLTPLRITELKNKFAEVDKKYKNTLPIKQEKYLFGIEVEAEQVPELVERLEYWTTTNDPSLRNNGIEFVSVPLRMEQLEKALINLNNCLPTTVEFTGRTSVHIHMNVRDLTLSQIINLVMLYTVVEKVLFKWVGHERENSPFCVPITDSNLVHTLPALLENPRYIPEVWNKYAALNLVPMQEKGTVEFRHMYGTSDVKTLITWCNMLACLKDTAKRFQPKELQEHIAQLNTNSAYSLFIDDVFAEFAAEFNGYPLQDLMERAVTSLKVMMITQPAQQVRLNTGRDFTRMANEILGGERFAPIRPIINQARVLWDEAETIPQDNMLEPTQGNF